MAIKNLDSIEKMLKLEEGTLQKGFESEEEISIELPDFVIRTKEEESQLVDSFEREKKERYDAGKEKGVKDVVNENLEKWGIDLTDEKKTFENFANALNEKLSKELAKPKDEKVGELQTDNEKLRANLEAIQQEYNSFKDNVSKEKRSLTIDQHIDKVLPTENLLIPRDDLKTLFKSKYEFEFGEDNNLIIKQNGKELKDEKTRTHLPIDNIATQFLEPYVKKQDKGSGGQDSGSKAKNSYDSFVQEMKSDGHNEGSAEFQRALNERVKEGTVEL